MAISLKKGQGISLKKVEFDLSSVTIGLGWDVQEVKQGFFSGLMSAKAPDYDLDVIAFLCGADGKVHDLGRLENGKPTLINGDVVFFNSMRHHSGTIWLTGDNRTGAGDGDDEQIIAQLNQLPDRYAKIVFVVAIYNGTNLGQSFAKVSNAFIRAVDARGKEMARYDLTGGSGFENCRSMLFAELVRQGQDWHFKAIGEPSEQDRFVYWLRKYVA